MYHTIEFAAEFMAAVEISPNHRLERWLILEGARLRAQVRPYVVEGEGGPVEVADLFFEDGTATRSVPFACFAFVD